VSKIEEATGYSFLTVLDAAFRGALEVNDHAPAARYAVSGTLAEGSTLAFDASASSDADVGREDLGRTEALTYQWQFSDGTSAAGRTASHTFAKFGSYTATLTVTDAFGWPSTVTQTLNIGDVAATVSALPSKELIAGETYSAAGSFSDPGADVWSATVNYGDGTGAQRLPLVDKSFAVAHTYTEARSFTLTVAVSDDGGATGTSTATINVISTFTATQGLAQQVQILAEAGAIVGQQVQPLLASLDAASKQIQRGNNGPAANELGAFVNKLTAAVVSGRMSSDAAQLLTTTATRIQRVLGQ
jgi:PKD repeat protein